MIDKTFSHYHVIEKLGEGGMGVVYLAEDTLLRRRVAIKFPAVSASRSRLLAEARAASALNHSAIAAIYDCGELDGAPYIVMELVEGASLSEVLRDGPLTVERSLDIATQIGEALREAHSRHIIHRDIKPSNIRIDRRGAVKVVDFGLAKSLAAGAAGVGTNTFETQTIEGTISGTPRYMSPEQARGESGDERTDIFSLGAVLYECLAGKPPFEGASMVVVLAQVLHAEPPPPSRINRSVAPALDAIVRKMMAKEPGERFQSAEALLAALAKARAAGRFTRLVSIRLPFAAPKQARMAALAAALAAALGGAWLAQRWRVYQPGADVLKWYQEGVGAIRDGTYFKAVKVLEQAVKLDSRYPLAHARLAEAYNELDDTNRAQQEMLKAEGGGACVSGRDELNIHAIYAIVTADFAEGVKGYRRMLDGAAMAEKPAVAVDLGRALEKAQDLKGAMDSYQQAAKLDNNYPAAFLRLGVLAGRRQDRGAAGAAFDRAASLYESLSNVEGVTEVIYQRAVQASASGRIDEAAALLESARQKADAAGNYHQEIAALLQMCEVDIHRNDTAAAEQHVAAALDLARRNGLELLTARGLAAMGNAYMVRGDRRQAEKYFTETLDLARRFSARRTEARALLSLGSLYEQQSEFDKAVQEIEQALPFYEHGGYLKEKSQGLLLLGRARRDMGDAEGAMTAFQQLLQVATQAGDSAQTALVREDMGFAELYRERYPEALLHFQERTKAARSMGNQVGVAYGLAQSAEALGRLGRYGEAKAAIQEARSIASRPGGSASMAAQIDAAEAETALSEGRSAAAQSIARRLLAGGDKLAVDDRVDAERILGAAAVRLGNPGGGERACREALELARSARLPWLIPQALICHAEALAASGHPREALADAREAQAECARAGQKETEALAWLVEERSAAESGDPAAAREDGARAMRLLDAISQSLSGDDRKTFESRPDLQQWRKQAQSASRGPNASGTRGQRTNSVQRTSLAN